MSKAYASPLKIVEIREYARKLRSLLSLGPLDWISLPKLYDMLACLFSDNGFQFDYRVLPDNDPAFEQREEAYTDMQTGVITIKESVMEKACRKRFNRSAFTLAHELGHYFLHYLQRESKLCRVRDEMPVPVYCDPEW